MILISWVTLVLASDDWVQHQMTWQCLNPCYAHHSAFAGQTPNCLFLVPFLSSPVQHDLAAAELLLRDSMLLERHTPSGITPLGLAAAVGGELFYSSLWTF